MTNDIPVLPEWDKWVEVHPIVKSSFDFSWRPDPREPNLIYVFGNEIFDSVKMPTIEYHMEDATERKYMDINTAKLLPNPQLFEHLEDAVLPNYGWLPDPDSPPYIYVWGNQWNSAEDKASVQFVVPGATEYKYMKERTVRKPCMDNWVIPDGIDCTGFDFSWEPSPHSPPYIYEFGTQWQKTGGPQYIVPGATEKTYVDFQKVKRTVIDECWYIPENIDSSGFDLTWHPDATDPAYDYVFATQWAFSGGPVYKMDGATGIKYVDDQAATALPNMDNWAFDADLIDVDNFDWSWHPYVEDQPYIYQFGTQWQKTGGPKYITPGADSSSPVKYIDTRILKAKRLPHKDAKWRTLNDYKIKSFDYSWHPDDTDEPYIYVFGNTQYPAEEMPTIEYRVPGASTIKYVSELVATLDVDMASWIIPDDIDVVGFDFSWHPNPNDPPYIYEFGTQWQKTGGPRYVVKGATETKYIDTQKVKKTKVDDCWYIPENIDPSGFDFTWHPDATDPAYDYVFATQWAFSGGPVYKMDEATGIKYVDDQTATAKPNMDNWAFDSDTIDVDSFDWSWHPYVEDQPYIYEFGTQWQANGGPKYITPGADSSSPIKYIDTRILKAKRLPSKDAKWHVVNDYRIRNFDYSWHPDNTEEPFIYVFGNTQYPAEEMPTVEYRMPGATTVKYVHDMVAILEADLRKWEIPEFINTDNFDFSWHPNPNDPPYIYEFGTQWQKTGGPRYLVKDATETKYIDTQKVTKTSIDENWEIPSYIDSDKFDFTWHPDATNPAYDYVFPTQWAFSGGPIYRVAGSTGIKYVEDQTATANVNMDNWAFDPDLIDVDKFDWSWHPYVEDQPYIYEFGTQWQKTGGPRYITSGADSSSPVKYIDTRVLKATRLPNKDSKWHVVNDYKIKNFDYSWHPDSTEEPYIYVFGNNQYSAEEMPTVEYRMPGATKVKYVHDIIAVLDVDMKKWILPEGIDVSNFDFSWHPNPNDPPYIYEFATQWQKTGGPRYVVKGATETKYVDTQTVVKTSIDQNWEVPSYIDRDSFDFTWHPDATNPAYNYVFPTQWAFSGGPVYKVEEATEIKYVEEQTAKALPSKKNWVFDSKVIDERSIDFSWHPYVDDQPYIYEFGTQWQPNGGPRYIAPGATENSPVKYVDTRIMQTTRLPSKANWNILTDHPIESFDYSWHPDNTEESYVHVFGNTQYPAEEMPTVEYRVPGAETIKYEHAVVAKLGPSTTNWEVSKHIDVSNFDFSWIPHPDDPAFIYQFGTQWQKTGGPRFVVEGATQVKYVDTRVQHAIKLPVRTNWNILIDHDISDFDYSWHPDETEEPYIYVFGNTQYPAEEMPTIEYRVQGATTVKYVHDVVAKLAPKKDNWEIPDNIDVNQFDFSWVPHPDDPAFIYQFGTQWQKTGGPKYIVTGATQIKYVDTRIQHAIRLPDPSNFKTLHGYKLKDFDYSWHPDETAPPYIYQFGNNLYSVDECPTIEYTVEGATEISLVTDVVAKLGVNKTNWEIPEGVDVKKFDFTWVPHPMAPPYIYQFGTKLDNNDGPRYVSPNTEGEIVYLPRIEVEDIEESEEIVVGQYYIETTLEDLVNQHPDEIFWALRKNIDYTQFDFEWRPATVEVAYELDYVHVFGSPDSELTQTYFVSSLQYLRGNTDFKYVESFALEEATLSEFFIKPDVFYVDRGNPESAERFEALKSKLGNSIQKTRYLNSWVDTINRCTNRSTTEVIWVLNSELDYTGFNFDYYPNPWQMNMVHVFGTQWSHWGTTFIVNRETFPEDTKYIKIIEHLSNLNFVKDIKATATQCVHDIVVIDHGNKELDRVVEQVKKKAPNKNVTTIPYNHSYFDTLKDIITKQQAKKEHYIWICSSVCDYSEFDFSYISDPFAKDQLHVFPSGKQKFGDTFFIDVNKTREIIDEMQTLEDYHKVNYNGTIKAARLPEPVIITSDDTHVDAIKLVDGFPYATLITSDNVNVQAGELEPMSLWSPESKNIIMTSTGATRIVVPKEAKDHVNNELYDYPYIKRAPKLAMSSPLDIVFLSNGEPGAEENWEHLLSVTKGLKNKVVRVDGIDGRVAAYHAAAEASETPWMFTVFAKLKISPKFDFNWQPDRMQSPKHYIFHAKNPVNGLVYGHQAMIAYNKKLTLANNGRGLDFTLDDLHETVPLISGTAQYNTDPFSTWRTAFREVLKLKADNSDIANDRLDAWLNKAEGDFAQYSIKGAVDADEYYDEVDGDFDALKLSYEWAWLRQRFDEL
jgi:hypothetical protein